MNMNLNAQWIAGFTDGEGCFHIGINKNKYMLLGFQVLPEFSIVQHEKDIKLLYALKSFFGCGIVRRNSGNYYCFRVRGQKNLNVNIIPFFEKHRLKTCKRIDFFRFRKVLRMIDRNEHLKLEGLTHIIKIKQLKTKGKQN
jgi:hypothetical protein